MSSNEVYALLDAVDSEEEETIDNLMNDSDTEFVGAENVEMNNNELEIGLEAVTHILEPQSDSDKELQFC